MKRSPLAVATMAAAVLCAACVSVNKSVLSSARLTQPVPKESVQVFFPEDEVPEHERIAILHAEGDEDLTNEGQMIDKMREEAGKLGANAIILGDVQEPGTGAKVASALLGTSAERRGQAIAIYIPPPGDGSR